MKEHFHIQPSFPESFFGGDGGVGWGRDELEVKRQVTLDGDELLKSC